MTELPFNTNDLQKLYAELPDVHCQECGECCVSPTCTMLEFLFLMQYAIRHLPHDNLSRLLADPPALHPRYDGNNACIFLHDHHCIVHEARTGACRLFGIPSLADFKVPEMEMCKRNITVTQDPGVVWISEWVDRLFVLNSQLHLFNQSPYFVRGFNLACWLDVYFDTAIEVEPFVSMRRILRNALDLSFVTGYVPRTGLREKLICIKEFDELLNTKPDQSMVDLLISIRDAYPLTGTYFYEEAQAFLDKLQSLNRMT